MEPPRSRSPFGVIALVCLGSFALSCDGFVERPTSPPGPPGPEPLDCTEPNLVGAPIPVRRLTEEQLRATVRDVFDTEAPYVIADESIIGYRANTTTAVGTTTARDLMTTAETIAIAQTPLLVADARCDRDCDDWLLDDFAYRLFRRPLSAETRQRYGALFDAGVELGGLEEGVRWLLEGLLASPRFIYVIEAATPDGRVDGLSMASRLSYALWGGPPDLELLQAAEAGELDTDAGVLAATDRLIDDPRFVRGIGEFVDQWVGLELLDDVAARPDVLDLDLPTRGALRQEPINYVALHVRRGSTVEELLTSPDTIADANLDSIYGDDIASVEGDVAHFEPTRRAGLLTLAGVQAALAHAGSTSPTLRGRTVLANLLCRPPPPPPAGVVTTLPEGDPNATTRERFEEHFANPSCSSCHESMDGIGFAFEGFDWMGRSRETERGHPIDTAVDFDLTFEDHVDVDGPVELVAVLAAREDVSECVARHFVRYTSGVFESSEAACDIVAMGEAARGEGGLRAMIHTLVTSAWFTRAAPAMEDE